MNIYPKVVECNKKTTYTIELKSTDHIESVFVLSKNDYFHKDEVEFLVEGYKVKFEYSMGILGEFFIKVNYSYKESKLFDLFCVDKELSKLYPFKGDLHMHTIYSDGKRTPLTMTLACLEEGMDFISITDHDNYQGSLEAIDKVKELEIDIKVFAGEEISVGKGDTEISKGNGHMLSINADHSIDDLRSNDTEYEKELEEIAKSLKDLDRSIDPLHYARNVWAIQKVKEANGLVVVCHPNWIYYDHKYHLHQALYKQMLLDGEIDGVEVYGDIDGIEACNDLAILEYIESGKLQFAPIGNSDAHDSDHGIGDRFTIVFASSNELVDIFSALKNGSCVAVKKQSNDHFNFIGKSGLSHYANFLLKEYYPKHKEYRNQLAKLYYDQLLNRIDLTSKIQSVQKKLQNLDQLFFDNARASS